MSNLLSYRQESYRKIIHISSSIFPLLLYCFGKNLFQYFIIIPLILLISLDYLRKDILIINKIYFIFFRNVTRKNEHNSVSGSTWVFIGIVLTTLFFNEKIAIISLLVLSFSDSAAALIGIKHGDTILFNKSLEGSFSFFISTVVIITLLTNFSTILIISFSAIITIVELIPFFKINDNLLIPLTTGTLLYLGGVS